MYSAEVCKKARLSRDARFDGKFFTAVKTTGIYCRTTCPVYPPKEINVEYHPTAMSAANAGFRPCLRCRPDSAPGSPASKGTGATLERALKLIEAGALQKAAVTQLAERLGVSDRYLRKLFHQQLGVSPKTYALYQQCLFAKKLLHQTNMPITDIALASGFESIRRFNDCFKTMVKLTPTEMRRKSNKKSSSLSLELFYRPPFDWLHMQTYLQTRAIEGVEWCDNKGYGRYFVWHGHKGKFNAVHHPAKHKFDVEIELDDISVLKPVVNNIRRVLDLDADLQTIEANLQSALGDNFTLASGIRLPGIWAMYEAGIRAILGQHVSVVAAQQLVNQLVSQLGENNEKGVFFPTPEVVAASDLAFLNIPQSRINTLRDFSHHYVHAKSPHDVDTWQAIKGIGPWTTQYAQMRGASDPDIYLATDLGIKKAQQFVGQNFDPALASPWRSYLNLQLWNKLK